MIRFIRARLYIIITLRRVLLAPKILGTRFRNEHRLNSCVHVIWINIFVINYWIARIANKTPAAALCKMYHQTSCKPLLMIGHMPLMMHDVFDSCGS